MNNFSKLMYDDVMNVAWNLMGEAKARHFEPTAFLMGVSLFYGLRNFIRDRLLYSVMNDVDGCETLFGLPIKVIENDNWRLSLEVEEFSFDFEEFEEVYNEQIH